MILIHYLDSEKNFRIYELEEGNPFKVKTDLESKGCKILNISVA